MKMNKAWLRIAGLVLLSVITSGCMTTKAVTVAGKRMEYLNSDILAKDSVIVAEDGAIAVKARFGIAAGNGNPIFRCNKYVIASRSGVESSIYRTKTWREYDSHPRLTNPGQQYPPTIQISADCCGNKVWEVVPDGISRENMALEKIPEFIPISELPTMAMWVRDMPALSDEGLEGWFVLARQTLAQAVPENQAWYKSSWEYIN